MNRIPLHSLCANWVPRAACSQACKLNTAACKWCQGEAVIFRARVAKGTLRRWLFGSLLDSHLQGEIKTTHPKGRRSE